MNDPPPASEEITSNFLAVVESGLNLGAALTRGLAELAAGGRAVPPPLNPRPIPAMLHYVLEATRGIVAFAPFQPSAPTAASTTAAPKAYIGETLRLPMSIENPGAQPMTDVQPVIRTIARDGADAQAEFPADHVRFSPPNLTIAPRDLEKLTILITPPTTAPAGRYRISFTLRSGDPEIPVIFDLLSKA